MIISLLNGGLGNQLFQYAIGRKISLQFNTKLKLDTSLFTASNFRKYNLSVFNYKPEIAKNNEVLCFFPEKATGIQKVYFNFRKFLIKPSILIEKKFSYDIELISKSKENTYLNGYWQSENYFSDIRPILLNDLKIKNHLTGKNKELAGKITSVESVSVHIRRGDYVLNKHTNKYHGLCSLEYYDKAIDIICNKYKDVQLFIFSDDIRWVKENINFPVNITFVDHNDDENNFEDLRLMSLCKHNIIANSSFSWWGAWLNEYPEKVVIGPQKWLNVSDADTSTILPHSWIKL